jgi:hypothetical protein
MSTRRHSREKLALSLPKGGNPVRRQHIPKGLRTSPFAGMTDVTKGIAFQITPVPIGTDSRKAHKRNDVLHN